MPDETHCRRDDAGSRSLALSSTKGVENESRKGGPRGNEGLKWSLEEKERERRRKKGGRRIIYKTPEEEYTRRGCSYQPSASVRER